MPIGHGLISEWQLSSVERFKELLRSQNVDEKTIEFIIRVSYPKGHPKRLNKAQAAKQIFGKNSSLSSINKGFNALTNTNGYDGILCHLLFGEEIEDLKEEFNTPKRKKIPEYILRERARDEAEKKLGREFRRLNKLNTRGVIPEKYKEKYTEFVKERIDPAVKEYLTTV